MIAVVSSSMGTVLGIELDDGVLLAGDRTAVRGDTRVGDAVRRVFDLGTAGAAGVGEPGDIREFAARLEAAVDEYRTDRDERIGIDPLAHAAAPIAEATDVDAIVAAPDDESTARLRSVRSDGSILEETTVALGSGAQLAIGRLEAIEPEGDLAAVEGEVRDLFDAIHERDPETGSEIDTWTLESE